MSNQVHFSLIDNEWTSYRWVYILHIQYYLPDSWTANPRNIIRLRRKAPRIKPFLKAIVLNLIPVRILFYIYMDIQVAWLSCVRWQHSPCFCLLDTCVNTPFLGAGRGTKQEVNFTNYLYLKISNSPIQLTFWKFSYMCIYLYKDLKNGSLLNTNFSNIWKLV